MKESDDLRTEGSPRRRKLRQTLHTVMRWLHIYSSLFGLVITLFFAVTGLTLNHPQWFDSGYEAVRDESGVVDRDLIGLSDSDLDKLQLVEYFRSAHQIHAPVRDIHSDEYQINIAFAGPGYTADIRIDRDHLEYQFNEVRLGIIAVINDLHKGRDTGPFWSFVIDVSAVLLIFISLSGVLLLCWLKRRWRSGLITILAGTLLTMVAFYLTTV
ncbi:MAG: PepSY-associated TM helix domain-containing protein [Planctomycetaceae bacterium]|nr:PepSY-associated TM helix domain-containing protein [Planctomycetaceae bacterium]